MADNADELQTLVQEWVKSTDLKFLNIADFETILDADADLFERKYEGKTLEEHAREFLVESKLDARVIDALVANLKEKKWPKYMQNEQERNANRHAIEKLNVYGRVIERNKYEYNTHEIDYALGVVLRHVNQSLGDELNLPVGYLICFKFEKL